MVIHPYWKTLWKLCHLIQGLRIQYHPLPHIFSIDTCGGGKKMRSRLKCIRYVISKKEEVVCKRTAAAFWLGLIQWCISFSGLIFTNCPIPTLSANVGFGYNQLIAISNGNTPELENKGWISQRLSSSEIRTQMEYSTHCSELSGQHQKFWTALQLRDFWSYRECWRGFLLYFSDLNVQ